VKLEGSTPLRPITEAVEEYYRGHPDASLTDWILAGLLGVARAGGLRLTDEAEPVSAELLKTMNPNQQHVEATTTGTAYRNYPAMRQCEDTGLWERAGYSSFEQWLRDKHGISPNTYKQYRTAHEVNRTIVPLLEQRGIHIPDNVTYLRMLGSYLDDGTGRPDVDGVAQRIREAKDSYLSVYPDGVPCQYNRESLRLAIAQSSRRRSRRRARF
jgi:hypothetical protein